MREAAQGSGFFVMRRASQLGLCLAKHTCEESDVLTLLNYAVLLQCLLEFAPPSTAGCRIKVAHM